MNKKYTAGEIAVITGINKKIVSIAIKGGNVTPIKTVGRPRKSLPFTIDQIIRAKTLIQFGDITPAEIAIDLGVNVKEVLMVTGNLK